MLLQERWGISGLYLSSMTARPDQNLCSSLGSAQESIFHQPLHTFRSKPPSACAYFLSESNRWFRVCCCIDRGGSCSTWATRYSSHRHGSRARMPCLGHGQPLWGCLRPICLCVPGRLCYSGVLAIFWAFRRKLKWKSFCHLDLFLLCFFVCLFICLTCLS